MTATEAPPVTTGQRTIDNQEVLPPLEQITIGGTTQLGLFDAGGKKPGTAKLQLKIGTAKIVLEPGQAFKKGDTFGFEGVARVIEIAQKDTIDKETGIVVSAEQKHVAVILDLRVVTDDDS